MMNLIFWLLSTIIVVWWFVCLILKVYTGIG